MNNLKRVLSLGLSGVMLAGLLTVGASAADFTDAEDIQHTDAVNTLVALKVIDGKPDGSFAPEETVTRSQMAKMIAVAMNGGNDTFTGTKTTPSFSDIKGHWAEAYIEYCADLDIISGRGDGTFDPDATVTGLEATKMVLTALGYNAEAYQLIGAKWASRTDQLAQAASPSLYEDLAGTAMNANASRDTAAQLIWNGLQNKTVKVSPGQVLGTGETTWNYNTTDTLTLLKERYNGEIKFGYVTAVSYDKDDKEFDYTISKGAAFGAAEITDRGVDGTFSTADDVSNLFGQKVKIVYKDNKAQEVYGIFADNSKVLATAVAGADLDLDDTDDSVKVSGTTYKFANKETSTVGETAADIEVYDFNTTTNVALDAYDTTTTHAFAVDLIDNDNDGKVNVAVAHPIVVGEVTYVGTKSITAGNVSYKFDECDIYEDVAKNDWVVVTPAVNTANDTAVVAKIDVISGELTANRNGGEDKKIGDEWYTDVSGDAMSLGSTYDIVAVNGYIYNAEETEDSASSKNVLLVTKVDDAGTGIDEGTQKIRVLFSDGSEKVVIADKVDTKTTGTLAAIADSDNLVEEDTLYTYATDKDGNYELTNLKSTYAGSNGTLGDSTSAGAAIKDGKTTISGTTYRFDDDAVIFVKASKTTGSEEYDVIDGKTVNDWDEQTGAKGLYYARPKNGFTQTTLAYIDLPNADEVPGVKGSEKYGWITGKPELIKDGDDYYVQVTIWNGSEEFTALVESTGSTGTKVTENTEVAGNSKVADVQKGTPVTYMELGNDHIEKVESLKSNADAVKAYAGGKAIEFDTAGALEINDDTVILYIDTANDEGIEGGSITTAQETAFGDYVNNVYAEADGENVKYIFVDTANNLKENEGFTAATGTQVTSIDGKKITVASGTTATALKTEVEGWGTGAKVKVYDTSDTEKSDGTNVAANWTVTIVAQNGDTETYTVASVDA